MHKNVLQPSKLTKKQSAYVKQLIPQEEPVFNPKKEIIKVCWPDLSANEMRYVRECIESGWISSQGMYVDLFEKKFAEFCECEYAVSCTNGTHALELALAALGIKPGDEVIVPTFTMIATANVVRYMGATPVFVDARPDTWNIDETNIEAAITPRTKAIIVVHIYGHPCEMDAISAIAKKHNLWLIEDAAEAHGAMYKNRKIGSLSDVACFSLYANKMITTGEGGIVTTNNRTLANLLYKLHNHAFSDTIHFWHEYLGYNFRMTNVQAAIGCGQLEQIDQFIARRRHNASMYRQLLAGVRGIQFPVELPHTFNTYWMFGFVLDKEFPLTRDQLRMYLADHGVETRTFFIPMHLQPIYIRDEFLGAYPVSERLCRDGLYIPSSSALPAEKIEYICKSIAQIAHGH